MYNGMGPTLTIQSRSRSSAACRDHRTTTVLRNGSSVGTQSAQNHHGSLSKDAVTVVNQLSLSMVLRIIAYDVVGVIDCLSLGITDDDGVHECMGGGHKSEHDSDREELHDG